MDEEEIEESTESSVPTRVKTSDDFTIFFLVRLVMDLYSRRHQGLSSSEKKVQEDLKYMSSVL